jgi:hypothetical protein
MKETRTLLTLSLTAMTGYLVFSHKLMLIAAVLFVLIALSSGKIRKLTSNLIDKLAKVVNHFFTITLLTLVYLFILTPVAGLQRFFFQNPILLRKGESESYFFRRNHIYTSKDFENPW